MIKFTEASTEQVTEKINTAAIKLMSSKAIYVLAILSAFLVLSGAGDKYIET